MFLDFHNWENVYETMLPVFCIDRKHVHETMFPGSSGFPPLENMTSKRCFWFVYLWETWLEKS